MLRIIDSARLFLLACGVLAFAGLGRAEDIPNLKGAKKLLESHAKTIVRVAHPTVTYVDCEYDGAKTVRGGFEVNYIFNWEKSSGKREWTKLRFSFDEDGDVRSVTAAGRSNFLAPFVAANVAKELVVGMIKDDESLAGIPGVKKILEESDAKGLLVLYLQFKQR